MPKAKLKRTKTTPSLKSSSYKDENPSQEMEDNPTEQPAYVPMPEIRRGPRQPVGDLDLESALLESGASAPSTFHLPNDDIHQLPMAMAAGTGDSLGGGGMMTFGISKDGISRAIIQFLEPPPPRPLTICFHFPGVFLSHKFVVAIIKGILVGLPDATVKSAQFIERNVCLGTRTLENRWLVTVSTVAAKEKIVSKGITLANRRITVRSYDEVQREEYEEYRKWLDLQHRMGMKGKLQKKGEGEEECAKAGDEASDTPYSDTQRTFSPAQISGAPLPTLAEDSGHSLD